MTLEDWLACTDALSLCTELRCFSSERKLHLLAAALLRRVWDKLPSHHSRAAVEATEKFADGLITADALLWARSQAERESAEQVWVTWVSSAEYDLLHPEECCPCCDDAKSRYECRVAKRGGILDGARNGLSDPAWVATRAAFHTLELALPWSADQQGGAFWDGEWRSMFATVSEILGEDRADPRWPRWRTLDVRALARGIHRDGAFDRLPILADALQDAGCDDEYVLQHCRRPGGHVRGCWVVDLAMGAE